LLISVNISNVNHLSIDEIVSFNTIPIKSFNEEVILMGMMKEFKEFAVKGNVVDMAVGIIIGVSFGTVVSSLVGDVIMPSIGVLLGGVDFSNLVFTIKEAVGEEVAVVIRYGKFIQTVVDFTIIAFAIFIVVKAINSFKRKEEEAPAAPPKPSAQEVLLVEIRDLLKEKK
jgi:large conductance mechanosensitive channel